MENHKNRKSILEELLEKTERESNRIVQDDLEEGDNVQGKNESGNNESGNNESWNNKSGNNESGNNEKENNHREEHKNSGDEAENEKVKQEEHRDERIEETGQTTLDKNRQKHKIHLLTIIGEIEGHENLSGNSKVTKYELVLPQLAAIEDSEEIDGVIVLLNTMGGDVEAGLAIAEMIASLSKPTVSLVLGGSHSIGGPIAVSTTESFIVPSGTMVIHPVRMSGTVIGAPQTFAYFKQMQNRIKTFVCNHCSIKPERFEELMMETEVLSKDVGTILVGEEAVKEGVITHVGGMKEALARLHELINENQN